MKRGAVDSVAAGNEVRQSEQAGREGDHQQRHVGRCLPPVGSKAGVLFERAAIEAPARLDRPRSAVEPAVVQAPQGLCVWKPDNGVVVDSPAPTGPVVLAKECFQALQDQQRAVIRF